MLNMILELVPSDSPVLREKCKPFNPRNPDFNLEAIIVQMFVVMKEEGGIGLAAPQVGIDKRLFVMKFEDEEYVCINPMIEKASKETEVLAEGCLSFPGKKVMVRRPSWVRVRYMTPKGITRKATLRGMKARCFQHELDHINGIVFTEKGEGISVDIQHLRPQDER